MSFKTDIGEMKRRWKLTLDAMEKEGIDCLVLAQCELNCPGASIYLTDILPGAYMNYFLFSKEGISSFSAGPKGGKMAIPYDFVSDSLVLPSIQSSTYSAYWFPEAMANVIKKYGFKKIGWCGMQNVPANVYKYFTENLKGVEFCDFSDTMDHIKAVKSPYEIEVFKSCVKLHDEILACVPALLKGKPTELELNRALRAIADDAGATVLNVMLKADKARPRQAGYAPTKETSRRIEKGDYVQVVVEIAAAENIWCECGRMYTMGFEPSPIMVKALEDNIKLQDLCASMSKPGAKAADVFLAMNKMSEEMGYLPEKRFAVHGQGYEIVDRPMFVAEETMVLQENMFFASHPWCINDKVLFSNCDNYLVQKDGSVRLSKTPREIFVIS